MPTAAWTACTHAKAAQIKHLAIGHLGPLQRRQRAAEAPLQHVALRGPRGGLVLPAPVFGARQLPPDLVLDGVPARPRQLQRLQKSQAER